MVDRTTVPVLNISWNRRNITQMANPKATQEAARKDYVEDSVNLDDAPYDSMVLRS